MILICVYMNDIYCVFDLILNLERMLVIGCILLFLKCVIEECIVMFKVLFLMKLKRIYIICFMV